MNDIKDIQRMVCLLLWFSGFAASESVLAQSSFYFSNYERSHGIDAPVFDALGNRLAGTNYVAMLYGGPSTDSLVPARATIPSGEPISPVPFTFMPNGQAGYFAYKGFQVSTVEILTVPPGNLVWLQVRAWDARLGSSYEQVAGLAIGGYGESNLFQELGGISSIPTFPGFLNQLQSFSLRPIIPEPGTWMLLVLGGSAVWWVVRWQRQKPQTNRIPK